jgi:hypothetical protein
LKNIFLILVGFFSVCGVQAFVPRTQFVLEKLVSGAGSGSYVAEYEVAFPGLNEAPMIKESWIVDSDQAMRVTATGLSEHKDQINIQYLYMNGQKLFLSMKGREATKISEDFVERFLFYRNKDTLLRALNQNRILPGQLPVAKPAKNLKEYRAPAEQFIRLSRLGGTVVYALGAPSKNETELNPGAWVEQDLFYLRKLRLPSKVEMISDGFSTYSKGLVLPKTRTYRWGQKTAVLTLVKVTSTGSKNKPVLSASSVESNSRVAGTLDPELAQTVQEFYERFR